MELVVAEKPKVAQKIAAAIGDDVKRISVGKVSYYELERAGKKIVIAPAVGHIYTLAEKKKSWAYPVFDIEWVPAHTTSKVSLYTKPYLQVLEKLGKKADTFVSACDYDIEGSTIAYNIFRFATPIKEGRRMKFSALTAGELQDAYDKRGDFDYNNAFAGETRHILDWYYGINLSRALMQSLKAASSYRILSTGRVQGPALDVLSDLEVSIRAFVPEPYWVLSANIKDVQFIHKKERFLVEEEAAEALKKTGKTGNVTSIEKREVPVYSPPCFDLTSLQVEAHRLFKIPPTRTLEIAQTLYEDSLITYPRTSSQKIPPTINVVSIVEKLKSIKDYEKLASKIMENKWFKIRQGKKDDPAHPAIHPTGLVPRTLEDQQKKLYDLIVKRFLAAFAPEAKRGHVSITVDSNGEPYAASGSRTVEKGWMEFYEPYVKLKEEELPEFSKGEEVELKNKKKTKKETKPPRRYTQASIISELEKRHLGTKATRSTIVDTLFKRGYVGGAPIEVTDFGLKVRDVLKKYAPEILDEELTRKIEIDMEKIQEGKLEKETVIKEGKEFLVQVLDKWKKNEMKIGVEIADAVKETERKESIVGKCDKCGNELRIIRMKGGKQFIGCSNYPKCKNAYPLPTGALVKTTEDVCKACGKPTVVVIRAGRRPFSMCIDPNCPSKEKWKKKGAKK